LYRLGIAFHRVVANPVTVGVAYPLTIERFKHANIVPVTGRRIVMKTVDALVRIEQVEVQLVGPSCDLRPLEVSGGKQTGRLKTIA